MSFINQAAFIPALGDKMVVQPSDSVAPGPGEILVQNHAWGINPVDWKMQATGLHIESFPSCLGNDIAGEVVAVGEDVDKFKLGDRVLAYPFGMPTKRLAEQAFQLFTIVQTRCAVAIPEQMTYETAAKLPLGIMTAAAALYNSDQLNLPTPEHTPQRRGQTVLVWGGSSNVGAAAIQLAIASGFEVVSTSSLANHDMVNRLGVDKVFDHASKSIEPDIVDQLRGRKLIGAFDAISTPQTTKLVASILSQLGGGKMAATVPNLKDLPDNVVGKQVFAPSIFLNQSAVGEAVWERFLPQALKSGQFRAALKTQIAGHGLESIQAGMDMVKKGVSGTKVVVLA